ncbi:hypothetical protein [Chryseolinea lacunae]|uniref:Uncharacterized protein n=1 Tax=Chryseolinea lacunae TaxID=2801331 RepID=A0ABS1KQJ6_9BACT|nr:hypothetical protein [Chryseolinea lacunae]MBL0741605.1 hypothetical protein [Chryseolinea lacunae]
MIRYLYHETTEKETREIDKALICDSDLQALYNELYVLKKNMDAAQLEPSAGTVLNIMSYARSVGQSKEGR